MQGEYEKIPFFDFRADFLYPSWTKKVTSRAKLKILQLELLLEPARLGLITTILYSIKIERLLFLKILTFFAFFDNYFWPFNKTHKKIIAIFVIIAFMASI